MHLCGCYFKILKTFLDTRKSFIIYVLHTFAEKPPINDIWCRGSPCGRNQLCYFCVNWSRRYGSATGQILSFYSRLTWAVVVSTVLRYRACDSDTDRAITPTYVRCLFCRTSYLVGISDILLTTYLLLIYWFASRIKIHNHALTRYGENVVTSKNDQQSQREKVNFDPQPTLNRS